MHTRRHRVSLCWTVTTQPIQCLLRVYYSPSVIAGVLRPKLPENPMSTITKALKKSRKRLPRFMITTNIGRCVLCCRCGRYGQHRRSMASSVLGYWHDHGANGSSLPTSLCLLPSPLFRGEGPGVRGIALRFDWFFDRVFNALPPFKNMNNSLNRSLTSHSSTPHPPTPSPLKRGEGEKSNWFRVNPMRFRFGGRTRRGTC